MGLFDGYQFDPQSYGGVGGLLKTLLESGQMPTDMGQNPGFAPPQSAPPQNGPTSYFNVGQQQFPMFGTPDPAALPQNAQPAQAVLPQQAPAPQQQNNGIGGFLDSINQGLQSIGSGGSLIGAITGNRTDPQSVAARQNQTVAQALRAHGVAEPDISAAMVNPELLKTLVTQKFGPQTVQSIGNGWVINKDGQPQKIYDSQDKTPQSVLEYQYYKDNLPKGQQAVSYGSWVANKGGTTDATRVLGQGGVLYHNGPDGRPVIDFRNSPDVGPGMSDDAVDFAARRAIAGDTKALVGLGRGNQGRETLTKINNRISELMANDPNGAQTILNNVAAQAGNVSANRALGTKETHFGVAEKSLEESLPIAQAASDNVPRTSWVGLNRLIQAGQTQASDPAVKRLLIATDTAAKDYARTINPTGVVRESDIDYARKILSSADGPEAYTAALDQLRIEAGVQGRALKRQKTELHGGTSASTEGATGSTTKSGIKWSVQ